MAESVRHEDAGTPRHVTAGSWQLMTAEAQHKHKRRRDAERRGQRAHGQLGRMGRR